MPKIVVIQCDGCAKVNQEIDGEAEFRFSQIARTGKPQVRDIEQGWVAKASQKKDDSLAIKVEYFCPKCQP